MAAPANERMTLAGELKGHTNWVTAIACTASENNGKEILVTGSRDRSLILWNLTRTEDSFGFAQRRLTGHSHFVSDVALSSDGQFALSASWDGTLRLWDLNTGRTTRRFVGHKKDVLSVAFSSDNRQIVSGSRDKTIALWNTLGQLKFSIEDNGHTDWVSCVRFSPSVAQPLIISGGWDRAVKVWNLSDCRLRTNLVGHSSYINTVTISPDGSLCASGGKDSVALLWDLTEGRHLSTLDAGDVINALVFSPIRYWLVAATASGIRIFDLESKVMVDEFKPEFAPRGKKAIPVQCISLAWSADGNSLYAGYTDGIVRVWTVAQ